ncbi:MAG: hypothetical protein FVQ79_02205 [Planctomycetes bacterium]|nr:hypothetical protein [Planctomycetota bacterium]
MLRKFKDIHEGLTCVIIGNGPSLADCPRSLLQEYDTFGANRIFLFDDGFTPKYYTVIDQYMIHSCAPVLGDYYPDAMFIRRGFPIPRSHQIRCVVENGFSMDINNKVVMGGTVTFANLQIAYYMGYIKALLVGVDHEYKGMDNVQPGTVFQANQPDVDHFSKHYFAEGSLYAAPELKGTELSYKLAREVYEADNRQIINITPGSKLKVFERGEYKDHL